MRFPPGTYVRFARPGKSPLMLVVATLSYEQWTNYVYPDGPDVVLLKNPQRHLADGYLATVVKRLNVNANDCVYDYGLVGVEPDDNEVI